MAAAAHTVGQLHLANPRADRVRATARLATPQGRERAGAFLAEGPQAVREALAVGRGVRTVIATPAILERSAWLGPGAHDAGAELLTCTDEVLKALAGTRTPQGVVAVCDALRPSLEEALAGPAGAPPLVAVLARVQDPGNAGTVVRVADAAGAGAVVLTRGSVDVHNPKAVRATAGSLFHLPVVQGSDLSAAVSALHTAGHCVLATDGVPGRGSADLDDLLDDAEQGRGPLAGPTAWLFGNEASGLDPAEREQADLAVRVPLHGRAESLNLATAAAVCLYASARAQGQAQRRAALQGVGVSTPAVIHTGAVTRSATPARGEACR